MPDELSDAFRLEFCSPGIRSVGRGLTTVGGRGRMYGLSSRFRSLTGR
jgi:hypothetical protein